MHGEGVDLRSFAPPFRFGDGADAATMASDAESGLACCLYTHDSLCTLGLGQPFRGGLKGTGRPRGPLTGHRGSI